jgi:two-component system, NarL family, nitrate/nitrite response regulator NarL
MRGEESPMRLVLCDDNRLLCEALTAVFHGRGHRVLAITTRAAECVAAVTRHEPDACLLDVRLPDGSGLDAARAMRRCRPDTKIVMLSCVSDTATFSAAKKIGVAGFLRKDQKPDSIAGALDVIGAGGVTFDTRLSRQPSWRITRPHEGPLEALTPREREVLRRIIAGQTTGQMAREMDVATSTLRSYIKNILAKLGAHSRLQAAAIASREPGLVNGTRRIPAQPTLRLE